MAYWKNKACLVTGGSAGFGLELGRALADVGARVMLVARRAEPLAAAVDELRRSGGEAVGEAADVTRQDDVDRVVARAVEQFGQLDLVCNCAGRSTRGAILDTTPEEFQQLLDVNFLATVRVARAAAPHLIARRGHLVNIGSLASKVAPRYLGAYPAGKFAMAAYTQQLRLELGDQGLHVMLVCPGPIRGDRTGPRYDGAGGRVPEAARAPAGGARVSTIDPARLAAAILRGCERRQPELVVPGKARLLFAVSQLSASWGDWLLGQFMRS